PTVQASRAGTKNRRDVGTLGESTMSTVTLPPPLTKKDFQTDQEVRWCPGCGDYAILSAVQSVFPELGIKRENFVVVSGIGCSSRFPYYMNTFGSHIRGAVRRRLPGAVERNAEARRRSQRLRVRGDSSELQHLQRRRMVLPDRTRCPQRARDAAGAWQAAGLWQESR